MKRIMTAALAAATLIAPLAAAPTAAAQGYRNHDRGRDDNDWNRGRDHDRGDRDRGRRGDRDRDWDRGERRGDHGDRWDNRRHNGYYHNNRWYYGPPPAAWRDDARYDYRQWRRGDRLPGYYRNYYRDVDYRHYRLRAPPRGYHYVRDDRGDFLLVGIATGVILGIIASQ